MQSDEALMAQYQKGDTKAFRCLLEKHQKPVFNYLFRLLRNKESAEEALQEVFLRVVRSRQDYRPEAKFTTWLYTLARHYGIDLIRKKKFHDHKSFEDELEKTKTGDELGIFSDEPVAADLSSALEINAKLEMVLGELNPEQRDVFVLRELQGLAFEEIAVITNASINTVKSRMRYALQFLQKRFTDMGYS